MGFFDSIKKGLGVSQGEFDMRISPRGLYPGGEVEGELTLSAHKDLNIFSVEVELLHAFRDPYSGHHEEMFEKIVLAQRISLAEEASEMWSFFIGLPPHLAPSVGDFQWRLRAHASLQGAATIEKTRDLQLKLSPILSSVVESVRSQFGFTFLEAGADEESIWMTFAPGGAVKGLYRGLEVAWDEQEDHVLLWIILDPFHPEVISRFQRDFDIKEGSVEIRLEKGDLISGDRVDHERILALLRPLFNPS